MKNFTVIGFYEESHQIFIHHVKALDDHKCEGVDIEYPGESSVNSETVISQPEVFGSSNCGYITSSQGMEQHSNQLAVLAHHFVGDSTLYPVYSEQGIDEENISYFIDAILTNYEPKKGDYVITHNAPEIPLFVKGPDASEIVPVLCTNGRSR